MYYWPVIDKSAWRFSLLSESNILCIIKLYDVNCRVNVLLRSEKMQRECSTYLLKFNRNGLFQIFGRVWGFAKSRHFFKTLLSIITCFTNTFTSTTFINKARGTWLRSANITRGFWPHNEIFVEEFLKKLYDKHWHSTNIPAFFSKPFKSTYYVVIGPVFEGKLRIHVL